MRSYRWILIQFNWCPDKKRRSRHRHAYPEERSCKDRARRQLSAGQKDSLHQKLTVHPDLGLAASRTMRNKCLLFKPPSQCYFVKAAHTDLYTAPPPIVFLFLIIICISIINGVNPRTLTGQSISRTQ